VAAGCGLAAAVNTPHTVPVNLITGFLGVGKTTAIRRLLADKPADQYWAVLVNEFGEVGIDGAAITDASTDMAVVEVPGGCICCTTSPMLNVSIVKLLRARRPDRLLIEPSGLGHPAGIIDALRKPELASALTLSAVVTLVDPRQLDDSRYTLNPTWRDQIMLADVLVANKCDRADAAQVDRFIAMANGLFPPKRAIATTTQGQIDPALLDLAEPPLPPQTREQRYRPKTEPVAHTPDPSMQSQGWQWSTDALFSAEAVAALFQSFSTTAPFGLPSVVRAKAVCRTDHGWLLFNWAYGEASAAEVAWRQDSRAEIIAQGDTAVDWQPLEAALHACLQEARPAS